MALSEQELRDLVRDAVARHLQKTGTGVGLVQTDSRSLSHRLFSVASGSEGDGACLVEPAIRCNHCGYCQSYGH